MAGGLTRAPRCPKMAWLERAWPVPTGHLLACLVGKNPGDPPSPPDGSGSPWARSPGCGGWCLRESLDMGCCLLALVYALMLSEVCHQMVMSECTGGLLVPAAQRPPQMMCVCSACPLTAKDSRHTRERFTDTCAFDGAERAWNGRPCFGGRTACVSLGCRRLSPPCPCPHRPLMPRHGLS